jgi:hypothetical protein
MYIIDGLGQNLSNRDNSSLLALTFIAGLNMLN